LLSVLICFYWTSDIISLLLFCWLEIWTLFWDSSYMGWDWT